MKAKLMVAVAAAVAMFTGALRADITRYTEKVDGWTWEYEIAEGKAQYVIGWFSSVSCRSSSISCIGVVIPIQPEIT